MLRNVDVCRSGLAANLDQPPFQVDGEHTRIVVTPGCRQSTVEDYVESPGADERNGLARHRVEGPTVAAGPTRQPRVQVLRVEGLAFAKILLVRPAVITVMA